jgi:hypothetical protein
VEIQNNARYRGRITGRNTRKSKDELSEFIDIDLDVDQYFDTTTGTWEPAGDYGQTLSASYFIRSQGEVNVPALRAFAEASGWNMTDEQFLDETWIPNKVQVRVKTRAKADGKGHWFTLVAIVPYAAVSCGSGGGPSSLGDTLKEFRKITGQATPPPKQSPPPPEPLAAGNDLPF